MMRVHSPAALAGATAIALVLAGCDQRPAAIDAPAPAPLAQLAATAADLPYAEPAPVQYRAPQEGYRWAERAYGVQRAVYDAPPDYGFDYGDEESLAWDTADDWSMYAEPWDGGYRYYYYEPGAERPYFIRDRDYGYGYDPAGVLVAVFDAGGRYVSRDVVYRVAPAAGRYYARGGDLRQAARQSRRIQVDDRVWATRAPLIERSADPWLQAARGQSDWRAWRERDQDRELRRFEREQRARQKDADGWRERRAALETQPPLTARNFPNPPRDVTRAEGERWRQAQAGHQAEQRAQAERAQQQQQAQAQADQRQRAQAQQQAEAQRQRQAEQRADAARRQQGAEQRQQAQAQRQAEQLAEQKARQQAHAAEQQKQAQAQKLAQQQKARQEGAEQRQQAQAKRQAEQQAQQQARQQAQAQRQAQATSADARAKPASAHERGDGKPGKPDKPHGREKKPD